MLQVTPQEQKSGVIMLVSIRIEVNSNEIFYDEIVHFAKVPIKTATSSEL